MGKALKQMVQHDATGGILLMAMAFLALIIANSPLAQFYIQFLDTPVHVGIGAFEIHKPLLLWVNDGLMAIFFFLIGLEVKREILDGNLRSAEQIMLPAAAAVAGIVFPALFYVAFNYNDPTNINGWAIPSATDIAFALGIFSLFGKGLPISLKLFLLSVAIFDDIGAIIIIALFYSQDLASTSLILAGVGLGGLFLLNRFSVRSVGAYLLIGVFVWASVLKSGVHATLAGFIIAWFIPLHVKNDHDEPMLPSIEHSIQPWVALFILPLFAFANAGVNVLSVTMEDLFATVTMGIAVGLFIGKQVGIFGVCWLVIKLGWAKLPQGATWLQFYAVSLLCGVGFTMSLFIGSLAFENESSAFMNNVKLGVLIGSILSALLAGFILHMCKLNKVSDQHEIKNSNSDAMLPPAHRPV